MTVCVCVALFVLFFVVLRVVWPTKVGLIKYQQAMGEDAKDASENNNNNARERELLVGPAMAY